MQDCSFRVDGVLATAVRFCCILLCSAQRSPHPPHDAHLLLERPQSVIRSTESAHAAVISRFLGGLTRGILDASSLFPFSSSENSESSVQERILYILQLVSRFH